MSVELCEFILRFNIHTCWTDSICFVPLLQHEHDAAVFHRNFAELFEIGICYLPANFTVASIQDLESLNDRKINHE